MKKFQKTAALLLSLCLIGGVSAFAACGGDDSSENSTPTSESDVTTGKIAYTVTVQDQDGNPISGAILKFMQNEQEISTATTGADGSATGEAEVGEYVLALDSTSLPGGFIPDAYSQNVTLSSTSNSFTFIAEDFNPNGSSDRPYGILWSDDGYGEVTVPASTTYYYQFRGSGGTLCVENANVEVLYGDETYKPDGNGKIEVFIEGDSGNTFSAIKFAIVNKATTESVVQVSFVYPEGTMNNPIAVETLGVAMTYTITEDTENGVVYYTWTATESGTFTIAFGDKTTAELWNRVSGVPYVPNEEDTSVSATVNAGDTVLISVTSSDQTATTATVEITATFVAASVAE